MRTSSISDADDRIISRIKGDDFKKLSKISSFTTKVLKIHPEACIDLMDALFQECVNFIRVTHKNRPTKAEKSPSKDVGVA
jgi:hypothetical protein